MGGVSVLLCVKRWYGVRTNERRIMRLLLFGSPETVIFRHHISYRSSQENTPCEGFKDYGGEKQRKTQIFNQ